MARNISKNIKNIACLSGLVMVLTMAGCWSEFDFSAMELDTKQAVDYCAITKDIKRDPGTVEYAKVSLGESQAKSTNQLGGILQNITSQIAGLEALAKKHGFNADPVIRNLRQYEKDITPKVAALNKKGKDASRELAKEMSGHVRNDSLFYKSLSDFEGAVPQEAKNEFLQHKRSMIDSFKTLYKRAVLLAQSLPQQEAMEAIAGMDQALKAMKANFEKKPDLIMTYYRRPAEESLRDAQATLDFVRTEIGVMTSKTQVQTRIDKAVNQRLEKDLKAVDEHYVENVKRTKDITASDEAVSLYRKAELGLDRLKEVVRSYDENDRLKTSHNHELQGLVNEAFVEGAGVLSTPEIDSEDNDLVKLVNLLKNKQKIGLKRDEASEELIKALAIAVTLKVAERQGLSLTKVIGLNDPSLVKMKSEYSMSDPEFAAYVTSRAEKIEALYSSEGKFPNVYVIFADGLGSAVNIKRLADIFSRGHDKVIVVASQPEDYETLFPKGLDAASGFYVARAVLKTEYPEGRADEIAAPLVKMFYGLKPPHLQMDLVNLPLAVTDTMLRLKQKQEPLAQATIVQAAKDALSRMPGPIPVDRLERSSLLVDSFEAIDANLKRNSEYYRKRRH